MRSNTNKSKGIAARAGSWSARHRKVAIFGWLAFVVLALAIGGKVGSQTLGDIDGFTGESKRAEQTIVDSGLKPPASESVLVQSSRLDADDPPFEAAVADVTRRVSRVAVVQNVQVPAVSEDRHSALV